MANDAHPEQARISAICISPTAGAPMRAVGRVALIAGRGLAGDRYASDTGAYSKPGPGPVRHVTFIAEEGITKANKSLRLRGLEKFSALETRRNLIVAGMPADDLNALVGREFSFGSGRFRGVELADPCVRPGRLLRRGGFEEAFDGMGGLRAEVLAGEELAVGDEFSPG